MRTGRQVWQDTRPPFLLGCVFYTLNLIDMNKIGILFFALSTMGIGTLSAQTADSTQTSPWTKEGSAGLKLTQVSPVSYTHLTLPTIA